MSRMTGSKKSQHVTAAPCNGLYIPFFIYRICKDAIPLTRYLTIIDLYSDLSRNDAAVDIQIHLTQSAIRSLFFKESRLK